MKDSLIQLSQHRWILTTFAIVLFATIALLLGINLTADRQAADATTSDTSNTSTSDTPNETTSDTPSGSLAPVAEQVDPLPGEADHNPAYVATYAETKNLSQSDTRRLISIERDARKVTTDLFQDHPDVYGGLWMDESELGKLHLALTDPRREEDFRAMFARPSVVSTVTVEHSLAQLLALKDRMSQDTDFRDKVGATRVGLDVRNNQVELTVRDHTQSVDRIIANRFDADAINVLEGPELTIGEAHYPEEDAVCEGGGRTHCNPLRGGIYLHLPNDSNNDLDCTSGFVAHDSTYTSVKFLLTADHCADSRAPDIEP